MASLVAPGGSFEKFNVAIRCGADSVYVGGPGFGLRKSADNLSFDQLRAACDIANAAGKRLYVVLNGFLHESDINGLAAYVETLADIGVHAVIVSDLGVLDIVKRASELDVHVSTQASVCNWRAAEFWKEAGAKRVVVGRELSISECKLVRDKAGIEVETFVHGAMCASYSGKCVISNYTSGRDSNRGGCVQSCRHSFRIGEDISSYIMNAKDLNALRLIPDLVAAGIDAFKIEGRMKSTLYLANAVSIYRDAIDAAIDSRNFNLDEGELRLANVSNRGFETGGLEGRPQGKSISYDWNGYQKSWAFLGSVSDVGENGSAYFQVKAPFSSSDTLFLQPLGGEIVPLSDVKFRSISGELLDHVNPNQVVEMVSSGKAARYDLLVKSDV